MNYTDNDLIEYFNYHGPYESFMNLAHNNIYEIVENYKSKCSSETELFDLADDILDCYMTSIKDLMNYIKNHNCLSSSFRKCFINEAKNEMKSLYIFRNYMLLETY